MAIKRKAQFFVAFEKVEKQDDGTMLVSGVASSEAVDADGETITAEAMKAALPDYMKFGAIREMHQAIAAGTAIKCEVDAEGVTHLEAKIVDPTTVLKIEEDVLKGFSVGGKITGRDAANKSIITGIRLTEISVVDRPANPEAVFKLAKVEGDEDGPVTQGELRKGMGTVADLAQMIQWLSWTCTHAANEAEMEGDNSPVPGELKSCLMDLISAFQAMTAEETAELLTYIPSPEPAPDPEVMAMAAKLAKGEGFEDLAKAKFTATTKAKLNTLHKVALDAVNALAEVWAETPDAEVDADTGKAAPVADIQKVATLETDLAKAADDLTKAQSTIDTLTKRIQELEALPAPPKGVINANVTVSKSDDTAEADLQKQAEAIAKLPPEEQARLLIKAAHQARR